MIDDHQLSTLNVYEEAGGEIQEGRAAIHRVVLNRQRLKFFSDGTIAGTILRKDQFSWAWFAFTGGKYRRVAWDRAAAEKVVEEKFVTAPKSAMALCAAVVISVKDGKFKGPLYDQLTDDAVMYLNPNPLIVPHLPSWATKDKFICTIGHHDFYRS